MKGRLKQILLAALVIYFIWKFLTGLIGGPTGGEAPADLVNRPWIERVPRDERDMVRAFLFSSVRDHHVGFAHHGSWFRRTIDQVEWRVDRDRLTIVNKQDGSKETWAFRVWGCDAPRPFDLCLELSAGSKATRYYSRASLRRVADLPPELQGLAPLLEAASRSEETR